MRSSISALAATVALMAVAACSEPTEPTAAAPPAATAPVVLGGVDLNQPLRALGTEPFWGVDITPQALVYSGLDRPEQRLTNPGATVQGTTAIYAGTTDKGSALELTLIATECSDGMSDRTYPLTVKLVIGPATAPETLNGCAIPTALLATTPEQPVTQPAPPAT